MAGEEDGNAVKIALIPVDITDIADGYILTYDAASGTLKFMPPNTNI